MCPGACSMATSGDGSGVQVAGETDASPNHPRRGGDLGSDPSQLAAIAAGERRPAHWGVPFYFCPVGFKPVAMVRLIKGTSMRMILVVVATLFSNAAFADWRETLVSTWVCSRHTDLNTVAELRQSGVSAEEVAQVTSCTVIPKGTAVLPIREVHGSTVYVYIRGPGGKLTQGYVQSAFYSSSSD